MGNLGSKARSAWVGEWFRVLKCKTIPPGPYPEAVCPSRSDEQTASLIFYFVISTIISNWNIIKMNIIIIFPITQVTVYIDHITQDDLGFNVENAVLILTRVKPETPAAHAGLRSLIDWKIDYVNKEPVDNEHDIDDFFNWWQNLEPDTDITLTLRNVSKLHLQCDISPIQLVHSTRNSVFKFSFWCVKFSTTQTFLPIILSFGCRI